MKFLAELREDSILFMRRSIELQCVALTNNPTNQKALYVPSDVELLRDAVIVYKDVYKDIFGDKSAKQSNYWRPQIVKVTYGSRSVYRRLLISTTSGLDSKKVGMTYNSVGELANCSSIGTIVRPIDDIVEVRRGSVLAFWRRHPVLAVRISYLLGVSSIGLGIISNVLSLILHFFDKL